MFTVGNQQYGVEPSVGTIGAEDVDMSMSHAFDVQLVPPSFPGITETGLDSMGTGSLMFLQPQQAPAFGMDELGDFSFGGGFDQDLPMTDECVFRVFSIR
jgi:hypothetical protein